MVVVVVALDVDGVREKLALVFVGAAATLPVLLGAPTSDAIGGGPLPCSGSNQLDGKSS